VAENLWEFEPGDDEAEPAVVPSAEEAAVEVGQQAELARALADPRRREASIDVGDATPSLAMWDDEDQGDDNDDGDRQLDVEDLLEGQHYAFAPTPEND
jgi:hypothetical protein